MKPRTRKLVSVCIFFCLVILACQLSPFGQSSDSRNDPSNVGSEIGKTPLPGLPTQNPSQKDGETNSEGLIAQGFTLVGQLGGSSKAVAVSGRTAVLGQGPRVVVVDISDPKNLVLMGESSVLSGLVTGIEVVGNYAYATAMYGGLNILDISNPSQPLLLSSIAPTIPGCNDIILNGDVAYLACNPGGLIIVDVKSPKEPQILFQESKPAGAVTSMAKVGSTIYLANATTYKLDSFNVEDPEKPVQGRAVSYSEILGAEKQYDIITSIKPCKKGLCLGSRSEGLIILDLADPAKPSLLKRLGGFAVSGMAVGGNFVYLTDDVKGVYIIDISDPQNPSEIGLLPTNVGGWEFAVEELEERGLFLQNDRLYITDQTFGLTVADVGNPRSPVRLGSYMTPLPDILTEIRLLGNTAFVAARHSGFRTVDISDPGHPRELAYDDRRKNLYSQNPTGLEIRDKFAFISDSNYPFHVYDISDPTQPRQVGAVFDKSASDGAYDMVLNGDLAYLSGWGLKDAFYPGNGIWVIDIKEPANLAAVTFVDVANEGWKLSIANNYLYAMDVNVDEKQPEPISLRVFDLSNPRQPEEVNTIPIPELKNYMGPKLLTEKDHLYIGVSSQGILVYDISEPSKPERVTTIPILTGVEGMSKDKNYVFLSGINAYDISDFQKPVFAGVFGVIQAWNFTVNQDLVYVATTFQGMYVLRFDPVR